jgi:hypothetical protein
VHRSICDAADAAFCTLPAPQGRVIPARGQPSHQQSFHGASMPASASAPPAVDMSLFMDRYGGCFAPQVRLNACALWWWRQWLKHGVGICNFGCGNAFIVLQSPVKLADGTSTPIEKLRPGVLTWGGACVRHVLRITYDAVVPMVALPGAAGNSPSTQHPATQRVFSRCNSCARRLWLHSRDTLAPGSHRGQLDLPLPHRRPSPCAHDLRVQRHP